MADDLASQLAGVMVKAANLAAGNHSTWPIGAVQAEIAADLRHTLPLSDIWFTRGFRQGAAGEVGGHPLIDIADATAYAEGYAAGQRMARDGYACPDYTPDERHRHTVRGQTWEHAHEGGHEAHSAVSHDLSDADHLDPSEPEPITEPSPDPFALEAAARFALERLTNMTTQEFARGADRPVRRMLADALGIDPDDVSGPA